MNTLKCLTVATAPLLTSGIASAQTGTMMGAGNSGFGWMGGYGGGLWMQVLLIAIVVALVVLIIQRKDK